MNQLVFVQNGKVFTDSLLVAEVFEKQHKNVLQSIEQLDCSEEFRRLNFQLSSYKSLQNKELPKIDMTRDGFTFLAMGYTGQEAARFKEMYIGEFNRMEKQLTINTQSLSPQLQMFKQMFESAAKIELEQQAQDKRLTEVEKKVDHTAEILALNPTEWRKKVTLLINKIAQARDEHPNYQAVWKESYQLLEQRAGCNLSTRLTNRKKNMALEGEAKSKIEKVNNLDVIASDAKLVEIFLAIIKEMAIQYQVEAITVQEANHNV